MAFALGFSYCELKMFKKGIENRKAKALFLT
jgi:hypothetical protein